jgi:hypothetical protein
MPLLSFFAVVGSTLVGLLFLADAILPAREPLAISREFHGVSATLHSEPTGASPTPSSWRAKARRRRR